MKFKSIFKKSSIYLLGNLSSKVLSTLLIPIIAFYLQPSELGQFDYSQVLMGVVIPIVYLAIWESILKFMISEKNTDKSRIISTSFIFVIFSTLIMILLFVLVNLFITEELMFLICIMFIFNALAQIWQIFARALDRNKTFVISGIIGTIVNFILVLILVVQLNLGVKGMIISFLIGQLSIWILVEFNLHIIRNVSISKIDFSLMKRMLYYSAPLVLNLISAWAISGAGKIVIMQNLGSVENGYFAFASKFAMAVNLFASVITMAIIEEAIRNYETDNFNIKFSNAMNVLMKFFVSITLISIPSVLVFYYFIRNTQYYLSYNLIPFVLLYSLITTMSSNIGSYFQASSNTQYQFYSTLIGATLNVFLSILLINYLGVYAVVLGQIIGSFMVFVFRYYFIKKHSSIQLESKTIIFFLICFIFLNVLVIFKEILLNLMAFVIVFIVVLIWNKKEIVEFIKIFK